MSDDLHNNLRNNQLDDASDNSSPKTIVLEDPAQNNSAQKNTLNNSEFDLHFDLDVLELEDLESDYLPNGSYQASSTDEPITHRFYLKLFGSPRLSYRGDSVKLGTRKAMALLSYLALRRTPVQRHELDTLLWPEKDEKRARRSLRDEISRINRTMGEELIISFEQELSLSPQLAVDAWEFTAGIDKLSNFQEVDIGFFEKVIALYDDRLLAGFHIQNAQPFEDWLELEREDYQHKYLEALLSLSHGAKNYGNYATAVNYMQRAIEVSPYSEEYYLYAIEYALLNGDRLKAQKLHQDIEQLLQKEFAEGTSENFNTRVASLGLTTLATSEKHRQSASYSTVNNLNNILEDDVAEELSTDGFTTTNHNLYEDALPFIGREEELRRLDNLIWEDDCKLITLVGLGGIGKTRLAKHAASLSQAQFPDGIWFIPIEKLDDPHELFSVIAECLSLSLESTSAYTACMNHLKSKRMLLIFDNLNNDKTIQKHVKTILRLKPGKILVTSTQHIGLQEEWIFDVRGLTLPSASQVSIDLNALDNAKSIEAKTTFEKLKKFDAIQLFVESAKQTQPSFKFSPENAKDVVTICEAADGIPLGLQLATRRLRTLSCEELAEEIRQGSDVLKTTFWDVPNNQRSLKAVFQSAFGSLRTSEKILYKKLSTFEGSFDRYEANELTGASVVDLAHFVEKSLLIKDVNGSYQMLNFVRRYIDDLS